MTQTATLAELLTPLVPVVGGAVIGVFGGLAGTAYAHRLNDSSAEKSERRTKLEELVSASAELNLWLTKQENYFLHGGPEPLEHSPGARIEALTALYFPELEAEVRQLSNCLLAYRAWMISRGAARVGNRGVSMEVNEGLGEVYRPFIAAQGRLKSACAKLMGSLRGK